MIKLHDGTWIDAHDVDSVSPRRGSMDSSYTEIRMKSGNKITLHPFDSPKSWADRSDRMPGVIREVDDLVARIMEINNQPNQ